MSKPGNEPIDKHQYLNKEDIEFFNEMKEKNRIRKNF
jgi:mannose/fructose/N-acetylgalactosamine-specific phosphotransferase system component IIB